MSGRTPFASVYIPNNDSLLSLFLKLSDTAEGEEETILTQVINYIRGAWAKQNASASQAPESAW